MDGNQPGAATGPEAREAVELRDHTIDFVRAFGLLRPDKTPCGQPLSASEAHALLELSRDSALPQGALGGRLGLEKSTVSRLVAQLEQRGWVERRRDPDDARAIELRITNEGRRMAEQVAGARAVRFVEILGRIDPAERPGVLRALGLLARAARRPENPSSMDVP